MIRHSFFTRYFHHLQVVFILLLSLNESSGQETFEKSRDREISKSYVGVILGLNYSRVHHVNPENIQGFFHTSDERNEGVNPLPGFTAGAMVGSNLSKNFSLELQFVYSVLRNEVDVGKPDWASRTTTTGVPYWNRILWQRSIEYVHLPLRVLWKSKGENFRFIASASVSPMFVAKSEEESTYFSNDNFFEVEPARISKIDFNVSPGISLGVERRLNDLLFLRAELQGRMGLLPIQEGIVMDLYTDYLEFNISFGTYILKSD